MAALCCGPIHPVGLALGLGSIGAQLQAGGADLGAPLGGPLSAA